jgi:predicted dehydrogenase
MLEMPLRFVPVTLRLQELLETRLGPARVILGEMIQPARKAECPSTEPQTNSPWNLLGPSGLGLLDWCTVFLGEPKGVRADGPSDGDVVSTVFMDFGCGRAAQLTHWQAPGVRRSLRFRVIAERGMATVTPPYRLSWNDAEGQHSHTIRPHEVLGRLLLTRFHQALMEGANLEPDLATACRALGWLRAAVRSRVEDRRIQQGG